MSVNESARSLTPSRRFKRARSDKAKSLIGVIEPSYNLEKLSYLLEPEGYGFVKLSKIPFHRFAPASLPSKLPLVFGASTEVMHTFNTIPLNRDFVVSVEMELPRFLFDSPRWHERLGLAVLASSRCRRILPMSDAACEYLTNKFSQEGHSDLVNKLQVFRGGLLPATDAAARTAFNIAGPIKALFVGRDGLRKGLNPCLNALRLLRSSGVDVSLTVIGTPTASTYIVPGETFSTSEVLRALLEGDGITHIPSAPNALIRQMMAEHDVLVLPTMDESLGWVIAEAALGGMPSISTNVFAIPELVKDDETGWIIPLPLGADKRWISTGLKGNLHEWTCVQQLLEEKLIEIFTYINNNRSCVEKRGKAARSHVAKLYDTRLAAEEIKEIYSSAMR